MTSDDINKLTMQSMAVLSKRLEVEMNAKNKAYYFILSHGYFKEFVEFNKTYHSENPHKDCVKSLLKQRPKL